jgi:hypothetical protein
MREVDTLPLLREILTEHKAASQRTGPTPCSSPPPERRAPDTTCAKDVTYDVPAQPAPRTS